MNFPSAPYENADSAPTQLVDDRSVWCNLFPKASSPGTYAVNGVCESMAEFFTADELATDLAGRPKRRKDLPCFSVVVGGLGPEPQQPAWLSLQTQPVTRYTVTSGPAFQRSIRPTNLRPPNSAPGLPGRRKRSETSRHASLSLAMCNRWRARSAC